MFAAPCAIADAAQDRLAQARTRSACDLNVKEALQTMAPDEDRALSRTLSEVYEPEGGGYRDEIEESTRRSVLSAFMDMATRFVEQVDHRPGATAAGILAGATLEEYLRNLADANGVKTADPDGKPIKAETLNTELCGKGVYDPSEEMQVTAWLELRNKAARAKRDEFTADEIRLMIQGVRDLMIRHSGAPTH